MRQAFAMGAVLLQRKEDGKKHPIAYYSKTLSAAERNYDVYDLELLAIVNAMDHWRPYLAGSPAQNRHILRSSKPAVLERTTQNQQKSRKGSTHVIRV
jgi:hypothetical protein